MVLSNQPAGFIPAKEAVIGQGGGALDPKVMDAHEVEAETVAVKQGGAGKDLVAQVGKEVGQGLQVAAGQEDFVGVVELDDLVQALRQRVDGGAKERPGQAVALPRGLDEVLEAERAGAVAQRADLPLVQPVAGALQEAAVGGV